MTILCLASYEKGHEFLREEPSLAVGERGRVRSDLDVRLVRAGVKPAVILVDDKAAIDARVRADGDVAARERQGGERPEETSSTANHAPTPWSVYPMDSWQNAVTEKDKD
jgi:hypothetical protein